MTHNLSTSSKRERSTAVMKGSQASRHHAAVGSTLRSTGVSSLTKKSAAAGGQATVPVEKLVSRFPIKVYDEAGVDVTPLPLLLEAATVIQSLNDTGSVTSPTDLLSQLSTVNTSVFGGGPFSRSVFTPSMDTGESVADMDAAGSAWAEIRQKRLELQEVLTEEDLLIPVTIHLEETDLIWMLNLPTVCVHKDDPETENIAADNLIYQRLCKSRAGNDLYAERGMNTFNEAPKIKSAQTNPISTTSTGSYCTNFDMHDTYAELERAEKDNGSSCSTPPEIKARDSKTPADISEVVRHMKKKSLSIASKGTVGGSKKTGDSLAPGSSSLASSTIFTVHSPQEPSVVSETSTLNENAIMTSELLKEDMFVMERCINLNTYQPKQAIYRAFPVITGSPDEGGTPTKASGAATPIVDGLGPNLSRLWFYGCAKTKGRNVACLAWSKANPDLIAVGYGQFEFTGQKSGLICCWCLKNPEYPERIYTSKHGVTALDFSEAHPNILAAGYYDGGVALYNVRSTANQVLLDSQRDCSTSSSADDSGMGDMESHNKHLCPVWQMQWVEKAQRAGEEKTEVLISVSTDGHVKQWSIRNGFECYDIMRLKKTPTRMSGKSADSEKKEGIISRYAGGLCFDFDKGDRNLYLVGTEEGYVHKCSCSYNEQYVMTYSGHTGPVYRVRYSPFVPDIFLSCSADWSLCLWHQSRAQPILKFYSTTKQVPDLCWSPRCSTVFACVTESSVEVWDLAQSTLDPVISLTVTHNIKMSTISFAQNTDCILAGDSEGQVGVYELRGMPPYPPMELQATKLSSVINSSLASKMAVLDTEVEGKESKVTAEGTESKVTAEMGESALKISASSQMEV